MENTSVKHYLKSGGWWWWWWWCVNSEFCVFGKKIGVLRMCLFVMTSLVSEQNVSD